VDRTHSRSTKSISFAGEVAAVKGDEYVTVQRIPGAYIQQVVTVKGPLVWQHSLWSRWSELRRRVLDGYRLQATVIVLPVSPDDRTTSSTSVIIAAGGRGTSAAAGIAMVNGPFSDCIVRAGDGREFKVHRLVLAVASPVFHRMLESEMAEGRTATVQLQDADPVTVELLLQHIYDGAVEVPLSSAVQLCALRRRPQSSGTTGRGLSRQWTGAKPKVRGWIM